jgi:hypothetical protein
MPHAHHHHQYVDGTSPIAHLGRYHRPTAVEAETAFATLEAFFAPHHNGTALALLEDLHMEIEAG